MNKGGKFFGMLGLARRAGKLTIGAEGSREAITKGRAHLLLLAEDVSPRTVARLKLEAEKRSIPVRQTGQKSAIGARLGREEVGVLSILDPQLARAIIDLVREPKREEENEEGR